MDGTKSCKTNICRSGAHVTVDSIYALLTNLVRSRWLDIGFVLFCVFIDRDEKGFIKWPKDYAKRLSLLRDQCGQSRAGKIGPSCPLG